MITGTLRQTNGFGFLAMLLGRASTCLGVVVAAAWNVGFAIVLRHAWVFDSAAGTGLRLPVEPPILGLSLAGLGMAFAWMGRQPICGTIWAGLALNALPLIEALIVLLGGFSG